ncbi:MAG TPA: ABC transporter ATP-binding protein [Solirubrobacteraceae bacterium]
MTDLGDAIKTVGLCKRYGSGAAAVDALSDVDFAVGNGEFVAIMGPSGSGKSTLLHLIGGLETPTAGTIEVAGAHVDGADDTALTRLRRERLGFVFQFFNLLPSLTALENVLLPALIAHRHEPELQARALGLLDRVGLGDRAEHTPGELSGGQQQRVSIARALLLQPQIVLADEPTGNLDSHAGAEVLEILRDLARDEGRTVVMVTHDPSAAATADRVVFLRDGRLAGELVGAGTHEIADGLADLAAAQAGVLTRAV